jgi:hypothetical protein
MKSLGHLDTSVMTETDSLHSSSLCFRSSSLFSSSIRFSLSNRFSRTGTFPKTPSFTSSPTFTPLPSLTETLRATVPPPSTAIPGSSVPPVATVPPASTQILPTGQTPFPTITPVATNIPPGSIPVASTFVPLRSTTLFPESTLPPVPTYPFASSHIVLSGQTHYATEVRRTAEPIASLRPSASDLLLESYSSEPLMDSSSAISSNDSIFGKISSFSSPTVNSPKFSTGYQASIISKSGFTELKSFSSGEVGNHTDAGKVGEDSNGEIGLLIASIVLMVLSIAIFSYLMFKEHEKVKSKLESPEPEQETLKMSQKVSPKYVT